MKTAKVKITVVKVRGNCAAGFRPGDSFIVEGFYILPSRNKKICLHALNAMMTFLYAMLKGVSARDMGIGSDDDIGYIQCPDPGRPYTHGGTVLFKLVRERID